MKDILSKQKTINHIINNLMSSGKKIKQINLIYNFLKFRIKKKKTTILINKKSNTIAVFYQALDKYSTVKSINIKKRNNKIFNYIIFKITPVISLIKMNKKMYLLTNSKKKKTAVRNLTQIFKEKKKNNLNNIIMSTIKLIKNNQSNLIKKKRENNEKIYHYRNLLKYFKEK